MLSEENLFFRFCALRIADVLNGRDTTRGNYRNLVRGYAQEFEISPLGEQPDETVFGAIIVLWKESCLELKKLNLQTLQPQDFSEFDNDWNGIWRFLDSSFRMKLRPEGRELLNEMEARIAVPRTVERKTIGFTNRRTEG